MQHLLADRIPRFIQFALIGTLGFVVDAGVMLALKPFFGLDPLEARPLSFTAAVTVTWALNRRFTFATAASRQRMREWVRYAAVNGVGALLNLIIFYSLMIYFGALGHHPVVVLAIASLIAMAFNFWGSKTFGFKYNRAEMRR